MHFLYFGTEVSLDSFVDQICQAMDISGNEKLQLDTKAREDFRKRLVNLLNGKLLAIAAKASYVLHEHDRTFGRIQITTDIRSIFGTDVSSSPVAAIIVHMLKLHYIQDREHKDFFLALDTADISILIDALKRAQAEAQTLKSTLTAANIHYIDAKQRCDMPPTFIGDHTGISEWMREEEGWEPHHRDRIGFHDEFAEENVAVIELKRRPTRKDRDNEIEPELEQKFNRLAEQWHRETMFMSNANDITSHFAYYQIIGMGPNVIRLILRRVQTGEGHWFLALRALTGANPVKPQDAGRLAKMAQAWVEWGKQRGLIEG
jgi:hypothetical protein